METSLSSYMDYTYLMDRVKDCSSPKSKITTLIRSGGIIRVRRVLYVPGNGSSCSMKTLANRIYGPSYISFEYALSYHDVIPEKVTTITSALAWQKTGGRNSGLPLEHLSITVLAPRCILTVLREGKRMATHSSLPRRKRRSVIHCLSLRGM